jgi:glycosyltransferase involved in cell wall biosynthesis
MAALAPVRPRRDPGNSMILDVITPVGPGHETQAHRAIASVAEAERQFSGSRVGFTQIRHVVVDDPNGRLGRSHARNIGMTRNPDASWFFFLDADDTMRPDALFRNDFSSPATFGEVSLNGKAFLRNVFPCGWHEIAARGARGTLSMGFFVKASAARSLRFDESLDAGEDFDFYMRLPGFTKIEHPLVDIGYDQPSAGGPRGYDVIDWTGICNDVIARYVAKEPSKYDLRGHAVLAKAARSVRQSGEVSRPLPA